ncbi:Inner membrane transport protein YeaN [Marinomonas aquimarina]|uniref:Inner membrane transport protein YeaN n=1 Tax=Marinomonas aquimarina TaxID=295068 RepID=A0A1A8TGJ9_9GAMM|nr:MFS transporter [Marinomonas aquimarina]SBS31112.1 Inner membrane transport protein YeaN [Marinomonas aquimarina]
MFATLTRRDWLLLSFIFVMALSLRGPVVGIAPLIDVVESSLHLSSSASGLLTTLPILAFALCAPLATWLGRRWGLELALFVGSIAIAVGIVMRSLNALPSLYLGVTCIGVGIAIGNVLLPILLKRDFPQHILQLTAVYVLMMNLGGAFMTGFAVPIAQWAPTWLPQLAGWSAALLSHLLFILPALLLWCCIPKQPLASATTTDRPKPMWRSPLAWTITLFLALDSVLNYIVNAWIPTILAAKGYDATTAGLYHSYLQAAGMIPAFALPILKRYVGHPRQLAGIAVCATLVSLLGYAFAPALAAVWSFLFGFGCTLGFVMGLSLISLRTGSVRDAAALSGMAQLVGYLMAAAGPVSIGALYDWTQDWQYPLYALIAIVVLWGVIGWFASAQESEH